MPLAVFPKCFIKALVSERTLSLDGWISMVARDLDVDGLEFHIGFAPPTPEERRRVRRTLADNGLEAPMMAYAPNFIQTDPGRLEAEIAGQKAAIEAIADLGGSYCRVLSGQWHPDVGKPEGLAMAAGAIRECIPFAAKRGVRLVLENHYKASFWKYPDFAWQTSDFLDLLSRIPADPNFGVNYDPSNALISGDDPIALLEAVKHRVVTMHASDRYFEGGGVEELRKLAQNPRDGYAPFLKHGVIGRGCVDYDRIFTILRDAKFQGWISIEDGDDPSVGMAHLQESAAFLRRKMAAFGLS